MGQLEIIHHDHIETMLSMESPCFRTHFQNCGGTGVINPDPGFSQTPGRLHQSTMRFGRNQPSAECGEIDLGFGRQKPHDE